MDAPAPPGAPLGSIFFGGGGTGLLVAPPTTEVMSPSTPLPAWNLARGSGRGSGADGPAEAGPAEAESDFSFDSATSSRTRFSASTVWRVSICRVVVNDLTNSAALNAIRLVLFQSHAILRMATSIRINARSAGIR